MRRVKVALIYWVLNWFSLGPGASCTMLAAVLGGGELKLVPHFAWAPLHGTIGPGDGPELVPHFAWAPLHGTIGPGDGPELVPHFAWAPLHGTVSPETLTNFLSAKDAINKCWRELWIRRP